MGYGFNQVTGQIEPEKLIVDQSDTFEFLEKGGMPNQLARRFEANAAGDGEQVL